MEYQYISGNFTSTSSWIEFDGIRLDNLEKNTGIGEYPEFDEGSTYSAGDVVSYNGLLYQFTSDHAAGAFDEGQVEEMSLKKEVDNINNLIFKEFEISYSDLNQGKFYDLSGSKAPGTPADNSGFSCIKLEVNEEEIYYIKSKGGNNARAYALTDSNRNIYEVSDAGDLTDKLICVKEKGFLFINTTVEYSSSFLMEKLSISNAIINNNKLINEINDNISLINNTLFFNKIIQGAEFSSGWVNNSAGVGGSIINVVESEDWFNTKIKVYKGQYIKIQTVGGSNARAYALTGVDGLIINVVANANEDSISNPTSLLINEDGYLYVNCKAENIGDAKVSVGSSLDSLIAINELYNTLYEKLYSESLSYTNTSFSSGWINNSAGVGESILNVVPSEEWINIKLSVKKGFFVRIQTVGGSNARAYALTDSNNIIYEVADANANFIKSPIYVYVEKDGYLYVNCKTENSSDVNISIFSIAELIKYIQKSDSSNNNETKLNVLAIGNSFTDDALRYISELLSAAGISGSNLSIYKITTGGASLDLYVGYYNNNTTISITKIYGNDLNIPSELTLKNIFSMDWGVVMFNQVSDSYNDYSTIEKNLPYLITYVKENCTNANVKIAWQMPWSRWSGIVEEGSPIGESGWEEICTSTKEILEKNKIDILVPTGTSVQNCRNSNLNTAHDLTRDGRHLSFGVGCYIAAATWYESIIKKHFGIKLYGLKSLHTVFDNESGSDYETSDVTEDNYLQIQEKVILACNAPYTLIK